MDLLGTIVDAKLKEADFATFDMTDVLEVIKADIMEEIQQANCGCSVADLVFYFSKNFLHNFTQGALLIAGCLGNYKRTREQITTGLLSKFCWANFKASRSRNIGSVNLGSERTLVRNGKNISSPAIKH